jgi:inner membrane protease subunit 1
VTLHVVTTYWYSIKATHGISMLPTIPNGTGGILNSPLLLIRKGSAMGHQVAVGDIVTYKHPMNHEGLGCKRVIGMPGDLVCVVTPGKEDKDLETEGGDFATFKEEMIRVPAGHCWLAGDNLEWSRDSRLFGPVPLNLIKGRVEAVVWPPMAMRSLKREKFFQDEEEKEPDWVSVRGP